MILDEKTDARNKHIDNKTYRHQNYMKSYLFSFILAVVAFALGYVSGNVNNVNINSTVQNTAQTLPSSPSNTPDDLLKLFDSDNKALTSTLKQMTTSDLSHSSKQQQIMGLLNTVPEAQLSRYLTQAFPEQDLENIKNKKVFAQHLIQAFQQKDDLSNTLSGKVYFSTNPLMPHQALPLNNIHPQQYIYAHFDSFGKTPPNTQVFVKWMNDNTQQVILFTPKYIQNNTSQNWVSFLPPQGWELGKYTVTFYEMTDELNPIAQNSYHITQLMQ